MKRVSSKDQPASQTAGSHYGLPISGNIALSAGIAIAAFLLALAAWHISESILLSKALKEIESELFLLEQTTGSNSFNSNRNGIKTTVVPADRVHEESPRIASLPVVENAIRDGMAIDWRRPEGAFSLAVHGALRRSDDMLIYQSRVVSGFPAVSFLASAGPAALGFVTVLALYFVHRSVKRRFLIAGQKLTRRFEQAATDRTHEPIRLPIGTPPELRRTGEAAIRFANIILAELNSEKIRRNMLELALESMNEGVLLVDPKGRVMIANPGVSRLLDVTLDEMVGHDLIEKVRISDLYNIFDKVRTDRQETSAELVLYRDKERVLQVEGIWIESGNSADRGVLLVLSDITTLKRLEQVRSDFVANVSHELRTPLTSLRGFAETLADGALEEPETARKFVGIIRKQAERLHAIIEDLLSLSRLEQSGGKIGKEICRVDDLIASAVEVCGPGITAKHAEIAVYLSNIDAPLNRHLFEQALINLIDNAVKYGQEGVRVELGAETDDHMISIWVRDNGPGIPAKDQGRLFERFYRVDRGRSRSLGGTGLGLAIVKHIAQAHQGHVTLTSTLGQGSIFTLIVPASM